MANPNPKTDHLKATQWKAGESGNPAGKPKGAKHINSWIQELAEDDTFEAEYMDGYKYTKLEGIPVKALVRVAFIKALQGDRAWADWIAKYGWSQKIETDLHVKELPKPLLEGLDELQSHNSDPEDSQTPKTD